MTNPVSGPVSFSLPAVLAALVSLVTMTAVGTYSLTSHYGTADRAVADVVLLRGDTQSQIGEINKSLKELVTNIQDIARSQPVQSEKVHAVESGLADLVNKRELGLARLTTLEKQSDVTQLRLNNLQSQMENLSRSSAPIPGTGHR